MFNLGQGLWSLFAPILPIYCIALPVVIVVTVFVYYVNSIIIVVLLTCQVEYDFMREEEMELRGVQIGNRRRHIVGTIAITKSLHGGKK